jgi:NAD(P)-dependent dehydrogenase (short-subunit alcohol dehydrogenase family)
MKRPLPTAVESAKSEARVTKEQHVKSVKRFAQMAALGRQEQPQAIANFVVLLACGSAGWITGQNIQANGGLI